MKIIRHINFKKNFKKRIANDHKLVKKFEKRYQIFITTSHNPILYDHKLTGKLQGFRAFSVTGDIRIIYKYKDEETLIFYDIGTHNQVY